MARRKTNYKRRRPASDRSLRKNIQATIIFSIALLLLGAFIISFVIVSADAQNIDKNFCRMGIMPEVTVVLVDHTDHISAIQKASLETRLYDIADNLEKNGAIKIYSVEEVRNQVLEPGFELCSPGSKKDISKWKDNERLARKKYEEKFSNILHSKLSTILNSKTARQSPIMKAAQSVVVTSFQGQGNAARTKKLILVSDLLEHTQDFSIYKGIPDFDDFEKGAYWPSVKSDMKDINVEIFYLHRNGEEQLQIPKLKIFWQMYFLEQGASSVKFTPIEG